MDIEIYNTFSKKHQKFEPIDEQYTDKGRIIKINVPKKIKAPGFNANNK